LKNESLIDTLLSTIEGVFEAANELTAVMKLVRGLLAENEKVSKVARIKNLMINLLKNILSYSKETGVNSTKKALKINPDDLSILLQEYHNIQNFLSNEFQLFNDIATYIVKNNLYSDFKVIFLDNISNVIIH
jgi:hypothetical protein